MIFHFLFGLLVQKFIEIVFLLHFSKMVYFYQFIRVTLILSFL